MILYFLSFILNISQIFQPLVQCPKEIRRLCYGSLNFLNANSERYNFVLLFCFLCSVPTYAFSGVLNFLNIPQNYLHYSPTSKKLCLYTTWLPPFQTTNTNFPPSILHYFHPNSCEDMSCLPWCYLVIQNKSPVSDCYE